MSRDYTYAQHFIRSPRVVAELIGHSTIRKNDVVYDLGAGSGVISSVLAKRCKRVVAIENEPNALKKLRGNMADFENVTIVNQDIATLTLPTDGYKIFSNIPFHLSAEIVRQFVFANNPPKAMYLIAQKQFARKLVPGNDHFTSQLAAEIGPWFRARIRKPLRKTDFTPPPAVDTVLLELKNREEPLLNFDEQVAYRKLIAQCFTRQKFFQALDRAKVGINPEKIPSQFTLEEWIKLYTSNR